MRVEMELPNFDPSLPQARVDELVIVKSAAANGYDCEVTCLGKVIGNLRIQAITVPNLAVLLQEATRTAWGAAKADIPTTDFDMTINRGGNSNGGN